MYERRVKIFIVVLFMRVKIGNNLNVLYIECINCGYLNNRILLVRKMNELWL